MHANPFESQLERLALDTPEVARATVRDAPGHRPAGESRAGRPYSVRVLPFFLAGSRTGDFRARLASRISPGLSDSFTDAALRPGFVAFNVYSPGLTAKYQ